MDQARAELSPGHLIKSLGQAYGLTYVAVQDQSGIIASSTSQVGFQLPVDDEVMQPLTQGVEFVSKRYESELGPVLEVARILMLDDQPEKGRSVLLRVGLDATLLEEMERDTQRRSWLRIILTIGSLFLMSVLLLAWQRQGVLKKEVDQVTLELKLREEQDRRSEKLLAMGSLAAGVAHEIRNPLNTIHMIAQNLGRDENLSDSLKTQTTHIRSESARIESIVQQFLEFARPRDPVFKEFDLSETVERLVAMHQAAGTKEKVQFKLDVVSCPVELDEEMVVEIVDNLLRNAVDAVSAGGLVQVNLTRTKSHAMLQIEDDGPGVAPEDRGKIFDLYYTTKPEGSGLGLSLVSRMVSAMDGRVSLDPSSGKGSGAKFLVQFPRTRSSR